MTRYLHIPREGQIRTWPPLIYSFEVTEFPPGPYIHMRFSRAFSDKTPRLSYSDQGDNSVRGPHLYMRLRGPNYLRAPYLHIRLRGAYSDRPH